MAEQSESYACRPTARRRVPRKTGISVLRDADCTKTGILHRNYSSDPTIADYELYRDENLLVESVKKAQELRRMNLLCDVTLKAGDQKFPVHRIVLATTIPYFHAIFTSEKLENIQPELTVQEIDPKTLSTLLDFVYTGIITISNSNVEKLLSGSILLQLSYVENACCGYLTRRLQGKTVFGILALADKLRCLGLKETASHFIEKKFVELSKSEEFLSLEFTEVEDIINWDGLHVSSEEEVYNAVMNWVKKDAFRRKIYLADLLTNVRMPLLDLEFIADHVAPEELIRSSSQCKELLDEVKDYHLFPQRRHLFKTFKTWPRSRWEEDMSCIYAIGNRVEDSVAGLEIYNPAKNHWMDAEPYKVKRIWVGVAAVQKKLYIIGGRWNKKTMDTVEIFDLKIKIWSTTVPMKHARSSGAVTVLNDKIYYCGGRRDMYDASTTVQYYDLKNDKWEDVDDMQTMRRSAAAVCLNGCIYVLGGSTEVGRYPVLRSVEKYDPSLGKWNYETRMITNRNEFGAATLHGKIYVCGGYDGATISRTAEVYDPTTKQWSFIQSMNVPRQNFGLVSLNGCLYAIGGLNECGGSNSVEIYNPEKDEWAFVAPMNIVQKYVKAVVCDDYML